MNVRRIAGRLAPLVFALSVLLAIQETCVAWPFRDRPSASDKDKSSYRDVSTETPVYPGTPYSQTVAPAGAVPANGAQDDPAADDSADDSANQSGKTAKDKPAKGKVKSSGKDLSSAEDDSAVGQPLAPGMMEILQQEIVNSVRERGEADNFGRFQRYTGYKLDSSAAAYTGSELAGNCRLSWYDHMLRHPLGAAAEAEQFTRDVHMAILNDRGGLAKLLPIIADKLDLPKRAPRKYPKATSPQEAIEIVKQALIDAKTAHAAALAPLTKAEIQQLATYIYPVMVANNSEGHTLNDRGTGRQLVDLMEKMDRGALVTAAEALVPLSDPALLEQLKKYPEQGDVQVAGASGHIVAKIVTPAGAIVIGGKGSNTYELDSMGDVAAVISLGGENTFYDGTVSIHRPLLAIVNLGGRNTFRSTKPAVQGAAILGVSMIVNAEGGNRYEAQDMAQASAIGGVGIIDEFGGDNVYRGVQRVQAQAIGGVGIIVSHGRGNSYHAGMWAQGLGGPLGFGIIDDIGGHDHYYLGGLYVNSYKHDKDNSTPGYEGFGQGVGGGIRQVACGGVGMLLNGGGHNVYEFDYLAHGGGYWCGLGFARDFGGYSKRLICRKNFYGGERTETLFQRFGVGWGCHYALGFCFDDRGHSTFEGTIMGSGMGWDCSVGALCVFGGHNHFEADQSLVQGNGSQGSLGILYQYGDNSEFKGWGQGYASPNLTYHKPYDCGGNFSFMVSYGNGNSYGCGAAEHAIIQRGAAGGFLISRPRHDQVTPTVNRPSDKTTASLN